MIGRESVINSSRTNIKNEKSQQFVIKLSRNLIMEDYFILNDKLLPSLLSKRKKHFSKLILCEIMPNYVCNFPHKILRLQRKFTIICL